MLILQVAEAHVDTGGEEPDQEVQIEEECRPSGRLVLRHGRNDRNMNLGIACIPQGVKAAAPGSNDPRHREDDNPKGPKCKDNTSHDGEEPLELLARYKAANKVGNGHQLKETEDS